METTQTSDTKIDTPIMENTSNNSIQLELGDIIELVAPSNTDIHEMTGVITYIDNDKITVINTITTRTHVLNITDDGKFSDESITEIHVLCKNNEKGYARQNNLLPKTWIDIHFGGEIPTIITGEITNLEEDMIEITTFPEIVTIYINFGYKGVPENLPIVRIDIRAKPDSLKNVPSLAIVKQNLEDGEEFEPENFQQEDIATIEFTETGESIINVPDNVKGDGDFRTALRDIYIDANSIIFGDSAQGLEQVVEIPESEKRYSIESQVNDLLDELLSSIPNSQRTQRVMSNIHLLIERFKELRVKFSTFDENHNIDSILRKGPYNKPLIDRLHNVDTQLRWIIPVVSNKKYIYSEGGEIEPNDTIVSNESTDLINFSNLQTAYYDNNNTDQTLTYQTLNSRMSEFTEPFTNPLPNDNHIETRKVLTNIDAIVDNLGEFKSTVFSNSSVPFSSQQYVIQRYNLGLSKLDKNDLNANKTLYIRKPLTPNDNMTVKSIIMMPESIVQHSKINLPTTNILHKSSLHETYFSIFRLLKKNTDIIPHVINDLSKELDYDTMQKENKVDFVNGIQEFILGNEFNTDSFNNDKYKHFLQLIVPKTQFLVELVKKYVKNNISFTGVVQQLEPYMVYGDDITFKQYTHIHFFIRERIKEIKLNISSKSEQFRALKNAKYDIRPFINPLLNLITNKTELLESFYNSYRLSINNTQSVIPTPQEVLLHMNNSDNGKLYTNLITSLLISLITPDNISQTLHKPHIDDLTDNEKIKPADCSKRFLTKKYTSMKELQNDNNVDVIYYDKDFDNTPYHILDKYKAEQKKMLPDIFKEFLTENLIHKHDCLPEIADSLADVIINGKKNVSDGEYAMLELRPTLQNGDDINSLSAKEKDSIEIEQEVRKKITYYRRVKDTWVSDTTIQDESFMDTDLLFCNISREMSQQNKNNDGKPTRSNLLKEFDKRFELTLDELESRLESNITYHTNMLTKTRMLRHIQLHKANNLAYIIGNTTNTPDIIISPHLQLRDLILGQDNFAKKQQNIITFVTVYCRSPMVTELNEHHAWLYCIETNTKLFPISLHVLAEAFTNNRSYGEKLDEICHSNGVLSDDGDSIIDKYSGFVLRKIDFSSEEGFTEAGFKMSSRDIMEKDLGNVLIDSIYKGKNRVFENNTTETIFNVMSAISSNIDINIDSIEDFIIRTSSELIENNILSEVKYAKRSKKMEKTNDKQLGPYKEYYNETMIIIVASVFIVGVQTTIPSFISKNTFPGCVRSFSGFPMDGIEDLTGIKYIACILSKMKTQVSPWDAIKKYKSNIIASRIKDIIEKYIITRNDITEMYVKKREYIILNPELQLPSEHHINKWEHFLPPVVKFSIVKSLKNVTNDFKQEVLELVRNGKPEQFKSIAVLKSKISQFGYGIIEYINHIVRTKDQLLKTSSQLPFLENGCCNEGSVINPIVYFNSEDNNINVNIKIVNQLSNIVNDLNKLTRAPLFYHPAFTGINYSSVTTGDKEELIYSTVIHYCNLDRNLPVPNLYKSICNERPSGYDSNWSLPDKIEFMKRNGKRYTESHLDKLMDIVFNNNIVDDKTRLPFDQINVIKEIIHKLDSTESKIIEEPLRKLLMKVLNKYNPKIMTHEKNDELKALDRYLTNTNTKLQTEIMKFLNKHGNLTDLEFNKITSFLDNITKWSIDEMSSNTERSDTHMHTIIQFLKNSSFDIGNIYPIALLSDEPFYYNVPRHWGISKKHISDIKQFIEKYYENLQQFKSDIVLKRLLTELNLRISGVTQFINHFPVQTGIVKNTQDTRVVFHNLFDKSTTYKIFSYCFYSIMYEYIVLSNDSTLLMADTQLTKKSRRETIANNNNVSNQLYAEQDTPYEDDNQLLEMEIVTGNLVDLKRRVASLLVSFIDVQQQNKNAIDMSYPAIMKKVGRSKDKEKQRIISDLGKLSIEERKIEDMFKKYKLGRWNIGQQKGIFKYDKNTYDRERNELITEVQEESSDALDSNLESLDIYDIERLDAYEPGDNYNRDTYDFSNLDDEFDDGDFYPEDRDEDEFFEE